MNIGSNIKKLRRERDITQEQLAEYLNISVSAISQWECDKTAPDISMLGPLANIFGVSADAILGIDVEVKEKRIEEIISKSNEYTFNGYNIKESTETLREGLKEYPNSYTIMNKLMECIWRECYGEEKNENRLASLKEIINFGEKILAECTDDECRHNAIHTLCSIYSDSQIGEREKAVKLANKMPYGWLCREKLLIDIYNGTQKFEYKRSKLYSDVANMLWGLCPWDKLDDGSNPHTPEICIVLYQKMIKILNLIFDDGNYLGNRFFLSNSYYGIAENYAVLGNYENAITNLKLAAEQAVLCDEETVSGYGILEPTVPPFKGMALYARAVRPEKMYADGMLKNMTEVAAFDAIRENKSFMEISKILKRD